jgi:CheY-like chemotaxis protein
MSAATKQKKRLLALIVDDLPASRQDMILHLESLGHDWVEAGHVQGARKLLKDNEIDYVLLDLQLPINEKSIDKIEFGKSFLNEIIEEYPLMPIVVVTAHGVDLNRAMQVVHRSDFAVVTFVPKPFVDDDPKTPNLTDSIKMVLDKAERLKRDGFVVGLVGKQKKKELEQVSDNCELGMIDVKILERPNHQQVVCTVNGEPAIFSPKEQEILAVYARVQMETPEDPNRHLIEVDADEFKLLDSYGNRHTILSRLRNKRIKPMLPENHPRVLTRGTEPGWYVLGCYCVDSGSPNEC